MTTEETKRYDTDDRVIAEAIRDVVDKEPQVPRLLALVTYRDDHVNLRERKQLISHNLSLGVHKAEVPEANCFVLIIAAMAASHYEVTVGVRNKQAEVGEVEDIVVPPRLLSMGEKGKVDGFPRDLHGTGGTISETIFIVIATLKQRISTHF